MASATSATRVMLPKAVTKSLHANSRCSLPFTTLQPLALGNSAEISVSVSFFAGMAPPESACVLSAIMRRKLRTGNIFGFGAMHFSVCRRFERFFVECFREFHYRRGFFRDENARCVHQYLAGSKEAGAAKGRRTS